MAVDIPVEKLAEAFKKLNSAEKARLKTLLGEEWFETSREEDREFIQQLLIKSQEQIKRGEFVHHENVINEVRKKYGM